MARSDSLSVTAAQLAGDALSQLIRLGSLGDIVFQVSPSQVRTFESFERQSEAIFADHEVAGGKPISEFMGESLDTLDLTMVFNAGLGVVPHQEIERLRKMKAEGVPHTLMMGSRSFGQYTLRSVSDEWVHISATGQPLVLIGEVNLVEYIEILPTQAQQKTRQDEIRRNETGKGGPERLPGASEPTQKRTLTPAPKIDSVTRMVIS
ncbi:hypothetical protein AHYW_002611 [Providencia manganoxydans]|uniref:phage tail protein n=1 Tax=Providencia manganoxydans TaxID=2923283 RepID=UPI003DA0025D